MAFLSEHLIESVLAGIVFYFTYTKLSKRPEIQNIILLAFGLILVGLISPIHLVILLIVVSVCYGAGLLLERSKSPLILIVTIGLFVGVLAAFRYQAALLGSLAAITTPGTEVTIGTLLPIGISFYTLQAISYVVDVSAGRLKASHNFVHIALYLSFDVQASCWSH